MAADYEAEISVIVPTCGRPALLSRAIASVANQTQAPLEIIVVNDGDQELACLRVEEGGLPCVVINTPVPRSGVSAARNLGASHASGDVLAFLDDDDWWDPEFLEQSLRTLRQSNADFVCSGFWDCSPSGRLNPGKLPSAPFNPYAFCVRNPGVTGSNLLLRKEVFFAVGQFDDRLFTSNDKDLAVRLLRSGAKAEAVPKRLVFRVDHPGPRLTQVSRRKVLSSLRFHRKYGAELSPADRRRQLAMLYLRLHAYFRQRGFVRKAGTAACRAVSKAPLGSLRALLRRKFV